MIHPRLYQSAAEAALFDYFKEADGNPLIVIPNYWSVYERGKAK